MRGQPETLWLLSVGLTRSQDKARVPALKHSIWRAACDALMDAESNFVHMTDGASAYTQPHCGILEHFAVNHGEHEWTRPEDVLMNWETGERGGPLASTNYLDSCWQKLKAQVPRGLAARTAGETKTMMNYVRAAQWRMQTRGEDKWEA